MDETYKGLSGMAAIVDDVLLFGKTKQDHGRNLRAMLKCTKKKCVRLNPDKCRICVSEVSFCEHTLSHEGLKPDPQKVKAVQEMHPPQSKVELETILRLVTYLARFAPHLSEINASLRQLLKQDNDFVLDTIHDREFQWIKDLIMQQPGPVLAYCDPFKELQLHVDVSKSGLWAVLQNGKPVAYMSKSLTALRRTMHK